MGKNIGKSELEANVGPIPMGTFTELETHVLHADRSYNSILMKLYYVNFKLGYNTPGTKEVDPKWAKVSIKKTKYYDVLGKAKAKRKDRAREVAMEYPELTVEQHDLLDTIGKDLIGAYNKASSLGEVNDMVKLAREIREYQYSITGYSEALYYMHKREMKAYGHKPEAFSK